jgi:hypothetical protein
MKVLRCHALSAKSLSRPSQWSRALDANILGGIVEGFPQIIPPLYIEPELGTVPKYPRKYEGSRRRYSPTIIAQLIYVLALHAHGIRQSGLREAHRSHELLTQNSADLVRLSFCHDHDGLTYSYGRLDRHLKPRRDYQPIEISIDIADLPLSNDNPQDFHEAFQSDCWAVLVSLCRL